MARSALIELMLMMLPPRWPALACATICRAAAWPTRKAPLRLTRSTRSKSASLRSRKSAAWMMPALLTRISSLPNAAQVSATSLFASSAAPTSVGTNRHFASPSDCAAARPASSSTSALATAPPSATKRCGTASPLPREPPVTIATLPSSLAMRSSPPPPQQTIDGVAAAARGQQEHEPADDGQILHELTLLRAELARIGELPEAMRDAGGDDHEQNHQQHRVARS